MQSPIKTVPIEGVFLSPVHVGWGQELDPFSCFIRGNCLYNFDLSTVMQRLSDTDRDQFLDLINRNSLVEIRKYLDAKVDPTQDALGSIAVAESLAKEYTDKIGDPRNQLIFQPFFRNGHSFHPVLPGTSLKGAIRTAVIDTLIQDKRLELSGDVLKNPRKMEAEVLGYHTMDEDPFKAVKCEDIDLEPDSTIIYTVFNYSPKRDKLTDLGLRFEATRSYLDESPVFFRTAIDFFIGYKDKMIESRDYPKKSISMNLAPEYILSACRRFYLHDLEVEHERFYRDSPYAATSAALLKVAHALADNECLIRVGRFTQAEAKSVNKYRTVMVRGKQGSRPMSHGTTRNLAAGRYPMGWIKLRFTDLPWGKMTAGRQAVNLGLEWEIDVQDTGTDGFRGSQIQDAGAQKLLQTYECPKPVIVKSHLEKLLDELKLIKPTDAGLMDPIVRKMENLESDTDKVVAATAFKEKLGKDLFKKSKFKSRIEAIISKGI